MSDDLDGALREAEDRLQKRPSRNGSRAPDDSVPESEPPIFPVKGRFEVPSGLSNFATREVNSEGGRNRTVKVGLSAQRIREHMAAIVGNWPKRVAKLLFVEDKGKRPLWIESHPELFAWLSRFLDRGGSNMLRWTDGEDKLSRDQFFAYLEQNAEAYESLEAFPHHPPLPGHYYLHQEPTGGNGKALADLVEQFSAMTLVDHDLIRAFFLTVFWGGTPGQRPAWMVTTDDEADAQKGRGGGKTTLAKMGAYLAGGMVQTSAKDDMAKVLTRLLSPGARTQRIVLIDNIKTLKFSWAELEAQITADTLSGHQMYVGEGCRPNTLLWCLTANGASLSRDMAQRTVIIKVQRPTYQAAWEDNLRAHIDAHRWSIVGDCLAALRSSGKALAEYSRWAAWEAGVLSRVADPSECQKVIAERQQEVDDDASEAQVMRDGFRAELARRGHNPDTDAVWIPAIVAAGIANTVSGEGRAVNRAGVYLNTLSIPELRKSDRVGLRG